MECLCRKMLQRRARANWAAATRTEHNGMNRRRAITSTTLLRAAKPSKPPLKSRVIPEYKTPTRKSPPLPPPPPPNISKPSPNPFQHRSRATALVISGILIFSISGYVTYHYRALTKALPADAQIPISAAEQDDVSSRYDAIASRFDDEVESAEWMMGITSLRKELAQEARGDVLEVSIGTGRNLGFYDWDFKGFNGVGRVDGRSGQVKRGKVRSFTAVDKSAEMLEVAHDKFSALFPGILGVRWVIADASEAGAIPGPPRSANERSGNKREKYDTVIQTMGLCSVADPVKLLRNLGEVVKEEEGRILLLEHGRGRWGWLNSWLDRSAEGHAKAFGCWWNRDISKVVEESGLEVVRLETPKWWHGGTTWWVELKKPRSEAGTEVVEKSESAKKVVEDACCSPKGPEKTTKPEPVQEKQPETKKKGWW